MVITGSQKLLQHYSSVGGNVMGEVATCNNSSRYFNGHYLPSHLQRFVLLTVPQYNGITFKHHVRLHVGLHFHPPLPCCCLVQGRVCDYAEFEFVWVPVDLGEIHEFGMGKTKVGIWIGGRLGF